MKEMNSVQWTIEDSTGILALDNPPQNYLFQPEFIPLNLVKEWVEANDLKSLIIKGTGRHFSGGAKLEDIFVMSGSEASMQFQMGKGKELLAYFENLDIPVVAAIGGICFGGGLEIALACHIRFCSENVLFAFPETNHGLIPGLGGTVRLGRKLPMPESLKMILGGDMINAEEALALNIVDRIIREEDLLAYTLRFLKKITHDRPLNIIKAVMQVLKNARTMDPAEAMQEETRMFVRLARMESIRRKNEK